MSTTGRRQLHRSISRAAAAVVLAIAALTLAAPAAAETCGKKVIDDWAADFRVDGTYALHCYDDAIEALPRDVRDYSSAKEDIERAMQAVMRQGDPPGTTTPDEPTFTDPANPDEPTDTTGGGPSGGDEPGDGGPEAAPTTDTSASSDSIPLPLLVLAGLALLLLAAGSLGYVVRRVQARRVPPASAP